MKNIKYIAILPLVALSVAVGGCSSHKGTGYESYKTYGEQVEDRKIINNIRERFRTNPAIPEHLIHLSIDRNIVQLSGFVKNNQEADLALLIVNSTPGVKDIIDNLIVLTDSGYAERRGKAEAHTTKR
jgi:osmotically-inducible protein OsmY